MIEVFCANELQPDPHQEPLIKGKVCVTREVNELKQIQHEKMF